MGNLQLDGEILWKVICTGGFIILLVQVYAIFMYGIERGDIERFRKFLIHNPDVDLDESLGSCRIGNGSLLRKRMMLIKEAVRHTRPASVSEFSTLSDENDHARWFNRIPNTFIGLFLIFGLAGTLYLLSRVLAGSGIENIVKPGAELDTVQLRNAISEIYRGFGTAFVASIAGISTTCVLVIFRGLFVNPARGLFLHDLDSLTVTELLPRLQPREVALPDALVLTSKALEQVGDKMLAMVEIVQAASDSNKATTEIAQRTVVELAEFSNGMKAAANALDRSVRRLDSTFGDDGDWAKRSLALNEGMGELSAKVSNQSELTKTLTSVTTQLHEILEVSVNKIAPLLPDFHEFLTTHRESFTRLTDLLSVIDSNLNAVDKRLESKIGTKITLLTDVITSLQEIISPLGKEQLAPLGEHVVNLDGKVELLTGALQEGLPRINTRLINAEKEIVAVLGVLKIIEAKITPLQTAAEAVVTPLQAGTDAIATIAKIAPSSAAATRELAIANAALVTSQESLGKAIEPLILGLEGLKNDISGVQGRLATVESAGTSIVNTGKSVETAMVTLATTTSNWSKEVIKLSTIIEEQTKESVNLRKSIEITNADHSKDESNSKVGFLNRWRGK